METHYQGPGLDASWSQPGESPTLATDRAPWVTIIVNNYNYARYLTAAIDSALQQTCEHTEVIVVDDGSTDGSRDVIERYGGRVQSIYQKNGGQASAFNAGLRAAHGALVIFLDADDVLLPHTAAQVAQAWQREPDLAKIEYRMQVIDKDGRLTAEVKPPAHLPLRSGSMIEYVTSIPYDITWMATSGNAFPRRVLEHIFPIPTDRYGRVGADWYLSHLTPLFGPVRFLEDVGAYYRVHGENNYEGTALRLDSIRNTIRYMSITNDYIRTYASRLGLQHRVHDSQGPISVSFVANRIVSKRLEPEHHPLPDTVPRLTILGIRAAGRRFDVPPVVRLVYAAWFIAFAVSPRPLARWLAELFFFPERRVGVSQLLARGHQQSPLGRARSSLSIVRRQQSQQRHPDS